MSSIKVEVPRAPALGLMLNKVNLVFRSEFKISVWFTSYIFQKLHYDKYNRKYGNDGLHSPLDWPELEKEIEDFKQDYIFSNIIRREIQEKS